MFFFPAGRGRAACNCCRSIGLPGRVESGCPPGRVILAAAVRRCQGITYRIGRGTDLQSVRVVADGLQIRPTMIRQPPPKAAREAKWQRAMELWDATPDPHAAATAAGHPQMHDR